MNLRQIIYFLVPSLIWGSTWFAIKFQLGKVDPMLSVAYRFLLAGILLISFCLVKKMKMRFSWKEHLLMVLQGMILFGFNYWLVYLAEEDLTSGIVSIIFSFSIFTNIFFNYLFLKGKVTKEVVFAAILGITGTFLIFNHELKTSEQIEIGYIALLFCFGSIVLSSLGSILSKYNQTRKMPVIQSNAFGMTYGSLSLILVVLLSGQSFTFDTSFNYIASLMYLAAFGSIIAFNLYLKLLGEIGPDRSGYITLVSPVVALIISSFFENYRWGLVAILGVFLLFAGNILVLKMKKL
jgi:drug/metabolite transporter (DMT)-like permease